jgi:hypothetical protein
MLLAVDQQMHNLAHQLQVMHYFSVSSQIAEITGMNQTTYTFKYFLTSSKQIPQITWSSIG